MSAQAPVGRSQGARHCDIAVIGSGFAGSLCALIARRLGKSVVLVERGQHPRFAIGESSTPLANLLLEYLARRYDLPRLLPLTSWGEWQRTYPQLPCGLKRGFSFFHHREGERFSDDAQHARQLLVAASPYDEVADTHWHRASFDQFLVEEARGAGADYADQTEIQTVRTCSAGLELDLRQQGHATTTLTARFVIDASGPRGCLFRRLGLHEEDLPGMPATQGLFAHFEGVKRLEALKEFSSPGNPPYPIDDAAVHHVWKDGWMWVLRFNNGITSAGVAVRDGWANRAGFPRSGSTRARPVRLGPCSDLRPRRTQCPSAAAAWAHLLKKFPSLDEAFAESRPVTPMIHSPRVAFAMREVHGASWAVLPSAVGVVDPLLSTGFPLALLGVMRLMQALEQDWDSPRLNDALAIYGERTRAELQLTGRLVGALYGAMRDFRRFCALSLLYFAAASYAESRCRLLGGEDGLKFLLADHPSFGPTLRELVATAATTDSLEELVARAIEPINVAGLADPAKRHWYPVVMDDLIRNAHKLGSTPERAREFIAQLPR